MAVAMKSVVALCTAAVLFIAALAIVALVVYSGVYNVGATTQHTQFVYTLLETTLRHSVRLRARDITPPPLDDPKRILRGASCFSVHCAVCHGAPGVSQGDIGKSMQPLPGPLVDAPQRWNAAEIYWITRHGIRMSGMPAWEFRMQDSQLWDIVAFVQRLPHLTPQAYAAATQRGAGAAGGAAPAAAACGQPTGQAAASTSVPAPPADSPARNTPGNADRGRQALTQYACNACHTIPGITSASPNVGPPLKGLASRSLIAGKLVNTPDNLVYWLRHPKDVKPQTAMPDLGVTEAHARDMAAYLATLH